MIDALRRICRPYYCRWSLFWLCSSRSSVRSARVPITAKVVADLLSTVGIDLSINL